MPGAGSSIPGRQDSNLESERAWLEAILGHCPPLDLERPAHLSAVASALAASKAKPSWLPHIHEAVRTCETITIPALPAGMPGIVARNLYITAFTRILASQTEATVAAGAGQQLPEGFYQQQAQPQARASTASQRQAAPATLDVKTQPQSGQNLTPALQATWLPSGKDPLPPSGPQLAATPQAAPGSAMQAAPTNPQAMLAPRPLDAQDPAQDPSQPGTAAHHQARLHSMLLSGSSPRAPLGSPARPLDIRPPQDLGRLPSGAAHPTVQLRQPQPPFLSSQVDPHPAGQAMQQQQHQPALKAEAGAASLLAAAGHADTAQSLHAGSLHKRHSTGARTGPEGKVAQQALRTNFTYFFPFKQRPDGDICSWTETASPDWMEGIPKFMAFLHERFPATRTHEVWGSHERVFKQVRTMFANAQRKARLAGGFIQSPAMHAQAAQLRADGAENSGAGSPQISEAKEQDIAEQDNADMPTSHAQGDGHAGPLGQVAGSQAPLTVPLPAIQAPTTVGEAMRHGGHEHEGSSTSSEQGRKRRHEDAIGPGNWPAPLPRQRPAPAPEQVVHIA